MSRFNLIDEKWIPVRFRDGRRDELGIWETLKFANTIEAIEDASPLVVAAVHRFLLALLYRALEGPTDIDKAKSLFASGLPLDIIESYLAKWRGRFWLFDDEFPFGQNPNVPKDQIEPWTKLTAEYNATSNKVLFDHTDAKDPGEKGPEECARWILSSMNFSISGGRGYYPSPSPNAIICIPMGANLEKTLIYCLVPYQNRAIADDDRAQWERTPPRLPLANPKRAPKGYADILTWQSRFLLLEETDSGRVRQMAFVAGEGFENTTKARDTMQPYREDKELGLLPIQFREGRGTWRDYDSLIPGEGEHPPMTIEHAIRLAGRNSESKPPSVLTLGLRYSPPSANLDFWRMERFVLPEALLGEKSIRADIRGLLDKAEDTQKALWSATKTFARNTLSRGDRDPAAKDVSSFVGQMHCTSRYWSVLEAQFHDVLQSYKLGFDAAEIELGWLESLRRALLESWGMIKNSVSLGDAWSIRAMVKAEIHIHRKTRELDVEIMDFQDSLKKEES